MLPRIIKDCFCVLALWGNIPCGWPFYVYHNPVIQILFDPHLTEEATEVQHGKQARLGSQSKEAEELAFTSRPPEPTLLPLLLY